ncbi:MAG: hypothetical protein RLY58_1451 [Pseudomonadota bacterium]|jgi:glycosyltransferase involved in cell wall biosynthesis
MPIMTDPKTPLKIVNTVYGDASGGRWQAMLNTTDALVSCGHQVWMATGTENQHLSAGDRPIHVMANTGFYDWIAAWKVRQWLKQIKPDVIVAHSGRAVVLFKNASIGLHIPVVAMNHSHNVKRTIRADAFIHITPHVGTLVQGCLDKKHLIKPQQAVIPNLIHLPADVLEPACLRQPATIGMLTRLVDYKGGHVLLDALAHLQQEGMAFRAILAGDGDARADLEAQTQRLGLTDVVHFAGWLQGDAKLDFYRQIDIVAVPSLNDTQPLAILDAFAWGKAVVSSDAIGPLQVCTDGVNALVSPCGDAVALAATLKRLIQQPDLALALAKHGQQEAQQRYAFDRVAARLDAFLHTLLPMIPT